MIRMAALSSPTFSTSILQIYAVKTDSVNFLFPVETAATCILDYTVYIHEKGKHDPWGKKPDEGEFSVHYSIVLHPT